MILPINTDAPIYHWPWATLSLVVLNVVTFIITGGGYESSVAVWSAWLLQYGNGLNPLEWVSVNFLHFGVIHLFSNMVFLWAFGLVVEGKVGWWKFLLIYFGIGISRACMEQTIMLGYVGPASGSGGASGVIYGLLAMSLVWAPKNVFTCIFFPFPRLFSLSIFSFCVFYLALQTTIAWLIDFAMSSEVIHLLGAVVGFAVASIMLKKHAVDCENWDLFAVLKGTYGSRDDYEAFHDRDKARTIGVTFAGSGTDDVGNSQSAETDVQPRGQLVRRTKVLSRMRKLLVQGKPKAALAEYQRLDHVLSNWRLRRPDLLALIEGLYRGRNWTEVVPLMEQYLERFPEESISMRLRLASLLIEVQQRPRYALRLLADLPTGRLPDNLERLHRKIKQSALRMIDEGVIELDGQAWS